MKKISDRINDEDKTDPAADPTYDPNTDEADDDVDTTSPYKTNMNTGKKSHHKSLPKAKNKLQNEWDAIGEDDAFEDQLQDIDLDENEKPPWTGYNSQDGSIIVIEKGKSKKYPTGSKLPNGAINTLPKLDWQQWANKFEVFSKVKIIPTGLDDEYVEERESFPAVLSRQDLHFMACCEKYHRLLYVAHRYFHKSTNLARFGKERIADYGDTVLYGGSTTEEAVKFTEQLRTQFMTNSEFKKYYGYILDDKQSNQKSKMFWLSQRYGKSVEHTRNPGLTTMTPKNHRTGAHPRLVLIDDLVPDEALEHPKIIANIKNWFEGSLLPMLDPAAKLIMVGTIKSPEDIVSKIIKTRGHMGFHVEVIPAFRTFPNNGQRDSDDEHLPHHWWYVYNKDGVIVGVQGLEGGVVGNDDFFRDFWIIPGRVQYWKNDDPTQGYDDNRMSAQEFLLKKSEISNAKFDTEYQLIPTTVTKGYLKLNKIRYFNYGEPKIPTLAEMATNCYAMFDQAYGSANTSCYNCIAIGSALADEKRVTQDGNAIWNFYIMDVFLWRGGGVLKKEQMIKAIRTKYPYIKDFGIEAGQSNENDLQQIIADMPEFTFKKVYQNHPPKKDEQGVDTHQNLNLDLSQVPAKDRGKAQRIINQWDTKLEMGQIYWNRQIGNGKSEDYDLDTDKEKDGNPVTELKIEESFPFGRFDLLDACGSLFDLCDTFDAGTDFFMIHGADLNVF